MTDTAFMNSNKLNLRFFYIFLIISCSANLKANGNIKNAKVYFTQVVVAGLCESDQYFYKCFSPSKVCQPRMREIALECVDEHKNLFDAEEKVVSQQFAPTASQSINVGECMGTKFENKFKENKSSNPACFDKKKWR